MVESPSILQILVVASVAEADVSRRHWMLMSHACAFNGVPICTAYDSLGPDGLVHSLNETEVRAMFTNADLLGTLHKVIGKCPTVKLVVYDGKPEQKLIDDIAGAREGIKLIHIDEVIKLGQANMQEARPTKADDIYCCMYTSGSSEWKLWSLFSLTWPQLELQRVCS